jgi:hypothetical protein
MYTLFYGGDAKMKKFWAVGLILLLIFVVSCGKKEVKKPTQDSKQALEAFGVVENIRLGYVKNDRDLIEKNTTKLGYVAVAGVRKGFDSVELTFTPALIEVYGDSLHVYVQWTGAWKRGSETFEDKGLAIFVLKEKPLKLDQVLRASPFSKPD